MGASPGPALGAGVIGDIFKLEERGRAMGFFFTVSYLSSMILTSFFYTLLDLPVWNSYGSFCWRYFLILFYCRRNGWGLQTYYNDYGRPGWITHYCSWRAMHGILGLLGLIAFTTFYFLFPETSQPGARGIDKMKAEHGSSSRSFVFINPLRSLLLLRSPTMLIIVRFFFYIMRLRKQID